MHSKIAVAAVVALFAPGMLALPQQAAPSLPSALPTDAAAVEAGFASIRPKLESKLATASFPSGVSKPTIPASLAPSMASFIASEDVVAQHLPTDVAAVQSAYAFAVKNAPPPPSGAPSHSFPASLSPSLASKIASFNAGVGGDSFTGLPAAFKKQFSAEAGAAGASAAPAAPAPSA